MLVAWLLLGELPASVQLLGGVLIVAGVVLVHLDEMRVVVPAVIDDLCPSSEYALRWGSGRPAPQRVTDSLDRDLGRLRDAGREVHIE